MDVFYIGIDISKETFDAAVEVGGSIKHHQFENSKPGFQALIHWILKHQISNAHFVMEATGSYWEALANFLHQAGKRVSVVNPTCVKRFAQCELKRTKTDKVDAGVIARFAKTMKPSAWTPPSVEVQSLQALGRRVHSLMKMKRQELNRLEAETDKEVRNSIGCVVRCLERELCKAKEKIKVLFGCHPELRRKRDLLLSIPGVGEETATLILSEIPQLELFDSAKQLVAYAGLAPKEIQSGTSVRGRTRMSKTGNSRLRAGLYMPAVSAKSWNPVVASFCQRLSKAGKPPMKVVGAAMRKLLHIIFGVLKSGKPFDPSFGTA